MRGIGPMFAGLLLALTPAIAPAAAFPIVRVAATLDGFADEPVVMVGSGPEAPMDRFLAPKVGVDAEALAPGSRAGLELPVDWRAATVDAAGHLKSDTVRADGPIHVAVYDRQGHYGYAVVAATATDNGGTVDAGVIRPLAGATLTISEVGMLPGIAVRVAASAQHYSADWLRVLAVAEPRAAHMLIYGASYPFPANGALRLPGLSPGSLSVFAQVPGNPLPVEKSIVVTATAEAAIQFGADDFFPPAAGQVNVTGIVRRAHGQPAGKARLVYSAPPFRGETVADRSGRFAISVPGNAFPGSLLIEASVRGMAPPFDRQVDAVPVPAPPAETLALQLPPQRPPAQARPITPVAGDGICENATDWPKILENLLDQIDTQKCASLGATVARDDEFYIGDLLPMAYDKKYNIYRDPYTDKICLNAGFKYNNPLIAVVGGISGAQVPSDAEIYLFFQVSPMVLLSSPKLDINIKTDQFITSFYTMDTATNFTHAKIGITTSDGNTLKDPIIWISMLDGEADATAFPVVNSSGSWVVDLGCSNMPMVWVDAMATGESNNTKYVFSGFVDFSSQSQVVITLNPDT